MTEAEWLDQVLGLARIFKWRTAHFRPAQTTRGWRTAVSGDGKGFPDLVLVRDRVIFAELKSDNGRPTTEQLLWHQDLLEAGAEMYLWRPTDFDAVHECLSRPKQSIQGGSAA